VAYILWVSVHFWAAAVLLVTISRMNIIKISMLIKTIEKTNNLAIALPKDLDYKYVSLKYYKLLKFINRK